MTEIQIGGIIGLSFMEYDPYEDTIYLQFSIDDSDKEGDYWGYSSFSKCHVQFDPVELTIIGLIHETIHAALTKNLSGKISGQYDNIDTHTIESFNV